MNQYFCILLCITSQNREREVKKVTQVSIIIPSFRRVELLRWNLWSLAKQSISVDFETIVVNDGTIDGTEALCMQYSAQLNLKYIFSGQRNLNGNVQWRIPGFANNIGVKKASGNILVLCCAEMFHLNETISALIQPIIENPKSLGIPSGVGRDNGTFLKYINENNGNFKLETFNDLPNFGIFFPFLMSLSREQYVVIGGYDEDFTGVGRDDVDFVDRLKMNGCKFHQTNAKTVHLYHPWEHADFDGPEFQHNYNLWFSRKGQIVRNIGREWGKL
jgi:glycosyltransferase involved in cell wall biosynthesis